MKPRILILALLTFTCVITSAQPPEIIYPGSIAKTGYASNVSYGPFNIGFSFTFYGNTYTQFYVSSNGLVTFGSGSADQNEVPIPTPGAPDNYIAAFWDDLVIDPSGSILYSTIGAAPNRKLVIQFRNMGFYPFPVYTGTFATILHETTNKIQVQYRLIILKELDRAHGGSATIGIENSDGTAGVQYAYHNPAAVFTGKAVSFTPDGAGYILDPDAFYDGVRLTTNVLLPEPGTISLISPAENSTTGTSHTFEWDESSNAATYSLKISRNFDLSEPVSYDAGPNLSYNVTGLTPDVSYYWGVFATNPTGFTWCEVDKFTTSSTPPLTAIPQTIWVEQGGQTVIGLKYSGGDTGPKTAVITSLPAQGALYQYNGGVKGSIISAVPADVTDQEMNVIYTASGNTGNGAGNFSFLVRDGNGDSPESLITINVSPPGIPNLLFAARGTNLELQFDRPMGDPAGKQGQFTVTVNGSPVAVSTCSIKPGDPYTLILTLSTPLIPSDAVTVAYTQGDVAAMTGGVLATFTALPVTLRSQTITFNPLPVKTYGDSPFTLSSSSSSGLGMTYSSSYLPVAEIAGNTVTIMSAGMSEITARQAGNAVYAPAKYIRTLTVNKATLTFTANDQTKQYLEPNPELTYQVTGFVNGDDQTDLNVLPAITTTAGLNSPAGDYPITLSGGSDNSYSYVLVGGVLTITKISQTITITDIPLRLLVGDTYTLSASSSSGLAVMFESGDNQIATVTGDQLTGISKGNVSIRAFQPGDQNYQSAEAFATVEVYSTHRDILYLFTPNNDGFNDLWEIPDLASYGKCDVRIYNRWGKPVFSSPDYNNTWDGTSGGKDLPEGAYYFVIKTTNAGTITGTVNIVR